MAQESIELVQASGGDKPSDELIEELRLEELMRECIAWLLVIKAVLIKKRALHAAICLLGVKISYIEHELIPGAKNSNPMRKKNSLEYLKSAETTTNEFIRTYAPELLPRLSDEDPNGRAVSSTATTPEYTSAHPPLPLPDEDPDDMRLLNPPLLKQIPITKKLNATDQCDVRLALGQVGTLLLIAKCIFFCLCMGSIHPAVGAVAALALMGFIFCSILRERLSEEEPEETPTHSALTPRFAK